MRKSYFQLLFYPSSWRWREGDDWLVCFGVFMFFSLKEYNPKRNVYSHKAQILYLSFEWIYSNDMYSFEWIYINDMYL